MTTSSATASQRPSLSDQVANGILDLIVAESLEAGALLPSEARLAERFRVSRVVVREACRTLAALGIVDIQHGRGMVVRNWSPDALNELLRFALRRNVQLYDDLLEVRFALETQAAELAAVRATPAQIRLLRESLEASEAALDEFEQLARADVAFHDAIFAASGNEVLAFIGAGFQSLLVEGRRLTYAGSLLRGETARVALEDHRRILAAIERKDPSGAGQAMVDHLNMTREVLLEAHKLMSTYSTPLRTEEVLALAVESQGRDDGEPSHVAPRNGDEPARA
ncbi:MAG TPA: FadR/GntR family transcriptional regulator [Chloroflexota bacterium]|nr:FadR/GntR family transcriptional regulator [Chloroflexota bacterium]